MLIQGNTKTGKQIYLFNLPIQTTCPGVSAYCKRVCYADWWGRYSRNRLIYQKNLEHTESRDFVAKMNYEIEKKGCEIIRPHACGDFYSSNYIDKWIKITKANPKVIFYCYTRSWVIDKLLPRLDELASLPNMQIWWSFDRTMPEPPQGNCAYMEMDDDDFPKPCSNIVFRVKRNTIKYVSGGAIVCPHEDGIYKTKDNPLKCYTCELCFKKAKGEVYGL